MKKLIAFLTISASFFTFVSADETMPTRTRATGLITPPGYKGAHVGIRRAGVTPQKATIHTLPRAKSPVSPRAKIAAARKKPTTEFAPRPASPDA